MSKLDMSETARLYHREYIEHIEELEARVKELELLEDRYLDMVKGLEASYNAGINAMREMWLFRHNFDICKTALKDLKSGKIDAKIAVKALDKLEDKVEV